MTALLGRLWWHASVAAEAWEYLVQEWWVVTVRTMAARYGTDDATAWRVTQQGWRALLVLTWPNHVFMTLEYYGDRIAEYLRRIFFAPKL